MRTNLIHFSQLIILSDINISFKAEDLGQCGGEGQVQHVQELDNFVQGQGSGQGGNLCQGNEHIKRPVLTTDFFPDKL